MPLVHFSFTVTANSEIYPLSLHDALPIWHEHRAVKLLLIRRVVRVLVETAYQSDRRDVRGPGQQIGRAQQGVARSEEHTSELQSRRDLVCRLLLEKKNMTDQPGTTGNCHS